MGIRVATAADLDRIVELGGILHHESPRWSRIGYDPGKARATIAKIIESNTGVVYLAERDGLVIGGIAGVLEQHWASADWIAHEVSFFLAPDARGGMAATRLVCALSAWADLRGAKWLHAGTSTGVDPERTAGLYELLGFTRCSIGLEKVYGS